MKPGRTLFDLAVANQERLDEIYREISATLDDPYNIEKEGASQFYITPMISNDAAAYVVEYYAPYIAFYSHDSWWPYGRAARTQSKQPNFSNPPRNIAAQVQASIDAERAAERECTCYVGLLSKEVDPHCPKGCA